MPGIKRVENASNKEIEKFDRLSETWWDPNGKMGALHAINPLRTRFILERLTMPGPKILDVGCGGGILSASLAKAGAQVTGLDLSEAFIQIARQYAQEQGLKPAYELNTQKEGRLAAKLFDNASYYPLIQLVIISVFVLFR